MASNLPPGADHDPRAPYNRGPPEKERLHLDVSVGVPIDIHKDATDKEIRHEIARELNLDDDHHLLDFMVGEREPL